MNFDNDFFVANIVKCVRSIKVVQVLLTGLDGSSSFACTIVVSWLDFIGWLTLNNLGFLVGCLGGLGKEAVSFLGRLFWEEVFIVDTFFSPAFFSRVLLPVRFFVSIEILPCDSLVCLEVAVESSLSRKSSSSENKTVVREAEYNELFFA